MHECTEAGGRPAPGRPGAPAAAVCVGVTIGLPPPLVAELERWRTRFGDPMAALIPAHITLVTTTPARDWEQTSAHARRVAAAQAPFKVRLQGTGTFRPVTPVVFLNITDGFEEIVRLHSRLQAGPLERDLEFDFHPHVTVAHDVSEAGMDAARVELADYDATFTVRSMGLYEHDEAGRWNLREELSFGDQGTGSGGRAR